MTLLPTPRILSEGTFTLADLAAFKREFKIWQEYDIYPLQLAEVFEITHPELLYARDREERKKTFINEKLARTKAGLLGGCWVYFPADGRLVHMVGEEDYYRLRTNRNRNLVTSVEQEKLRRAHIGLIGLSVGSGVATTLSYLGIGATFSVAEFDTLETTNLNRIRARVDQIGASKLTLLAEQIYAVNPFAHIRAFDQGITSATLDAFTEPGKCPDVIFEIIDSFEMKIHIRNRARLRRVPVIMVTNLGDRVLLDVERYDVDLQTPYFNGRAGDVPAAMIENPDVSTELKHQYAVALAGKEHIPHRALASVDEIGTTLVGRPQLASTVTVATGLCGYLTRRILLGDTTLSGSWLINFDTLCETDRRL